MIKKIKMPKQAGWLVPGLQVKRWFALILVGAVLMTVGILILFATDLYYNEIYSKCRNKNFHRMACIWDCDDWGGNLFQGLAKNEFVNNGY